MGLDCFGFTDGITCKNIAVGTDGEFWYDRKNRWLHFWMEERAMIPYKGDNFNRVRTEVTLEMLDDLKRDIKSGAFEKYGHKGLDSSGFNYDKHLIKHTLRFIVRARMLLKDNHSVTYYSDY